MGIYGSSIIVDSIIATWFAARNDEGPAFPALFNPHGQGIKLETIALVLAAVHAVDSFDSLLIMRRFRIVLTSGRPETTSPSTSLSATSVTGIGTTFTGCESLRATKSSKRAVLRCARNCITQPCESPSYVDNIANAHARVRAGALVLKQSPHTGITNDDFQEAAASYQQGVDRSDTDSVSDAAQLYEQDDNNDPLPSLGGGNDLGVGDDFGEGDDLGEGDELHDGNILGPLVVHAHANPSIDPDAEVQEDDNMDNDIHAPRNPIKLFKGEDEGEVPNHDSNGADEMLRPCRSRERGSTALDGVRRDTVLRSE